MTVADCACCRDYGHAHNSYPCITCGHTAPAPPGTVAARDERPYALERGGCWHALAQIDGTRWVAACGRAGEPYRGQPSSITYLASPPSPLCCGHATPAGHA